MIRLNRNNIAKGAAATAGLLLLSMALPLLAFAQAYIFQASYDKTTGTVTASVYTDETVTGNVYLNILDERELVIDSVYLSAPTGNYTVGNAVYDRYDFTHTVTKSVYDKLRLTSSYADPDGSGMITSAPYEVTWTARPGGGRGGGGGYLPPLPTNPSGGLTANEDGTISESALAAALMKEQIVTISLEGTYVLLPANVLMDAQGGTLLVIEKDGITLALPVAVLHFEALAERTDTEPVELLIRVGIEPLDGEKRDQAAEAIERSGARLRSDIVAFEVAAVGDEGRTAAIDDFDGTYVDRTLPMDAPDDPTRLTGVLLGGDEPQFVPTALAVDDDGRATAAVLKRPGNGTYAVVERTKTFDDIGSHWAREDIERMAGRYVVEGVGANRYEPDRAITRAEFATLLVRALGLTSTARTEASVAASFTDVRGVDWFADAVRSAIDAGLIEGYPDGSFRPNATIAREEIAAMITRAMEYVNGFPPQMFLTTAQIDSLLDGYSDADALDWARIYMAVAVKEGIVEGMTSTTLAPKGDATRAQSAAMLHRWLRSIDFIP